MDLKGFEQFLVLDYRLWLPVARFSIYYGAFLSPKKGYLDTVLIYFVFGTEIKTVVYQNYKVRVVIQVIFLFTPRK